VNPTHSIWQATAAIPEPAAASLPEHTEIAIVGAGVAGCACALQLAGRARVAVLEARSCAAGATGRSAGMILTGLTESYYRLRREMGPERAKRLWLLSRANGRRVQELVHEHAIDCGYDQQGSVALAVTEGEAEELRESAGLLAADGFNAEWREMNALEDLFPEGVPDGFYGARRAPDDAVLQPVDYCRGLLHAAVARGVQFCPDCEVLEIIKSADSSYSLATARGAVKAERVVLAGNARLPELHPFFRPNRIFAVRGQCLSTAPVSPLCKCGMTANHGYDYWRQTDSGNMVVGGFRWQSSDYELGVADETTTLEVQRAAEEFLRACFPSVDWHVENRWGGVMGFSSDGLPFIGALPGHSDLIAVGGFTGYGMSFGTLAGEIAGDLALNGQTDHDIELFRPSRFLR